MKKSLVSFAIGVILLFGSCKKHSSDPPPSSTASQWTFDGATHTTSTAGYESNSNELFANDTAGNFVRVLFSSLDKPTSSKHLVVLDYSASFTNANQCMLQVGNLYSSNPIQPLSTGKAGDSVFLSVSYSGKLTASFSNISVSDGTTTKTVSGKLIEQ